MGRHAGRTPRAGCEDPTGCPTASAADDSAPAFSRMRAFDRVGPDGRASGEALAATVTIHDPIHHPARSGHDLRRRTRRRPSTGRLLASLRATARGRRRRAADLLAFRADGETLASLLGCRVAGPARDVGSRPTIRGGRSARCSRKEASARPGTGREFRTPPFSIVPRAPSAPQGTYGAPGHGNSLPPREVPSIE